MKKSPRFVFVICAVAAAAGLSILIFSGAAVAYESSSTVDTQTTYNQRCASCHGRDGRGRTRKGRQTRARDMTDREWQDEVSDERLFNSINNGRGKMPAFRKKISESEMDALVAYVRRLRR